MFRADPLSVPSPISAVSHEHLRDKLRVDISQFWYSEACAAEVDCAAMSLKYALAYASYISILVLAKPLGSPGPRAVALHARTLSGDLYPLSMSNDSATSSGLKGDENIHIECNGSSYGFDLDITDCELAKAFVPANSEEIVWAERHTTSFKRYQPLPYRSMGEKAICYVEASLMNGATSGVASNNQIRNAAAMIRHQCYSNGRLQGGIATNIGIDKFELLRDYHGIASLVCHVLQRIFR